MSLSGSDNQLRNPYAKYGSAQVSAEYQKIRPGYPVQAVKAVLQSPHCSVDSVADIGSGTGIFARQIHQLQPEVVVQAVEPSAAMRLQLEDVAGKDGQALWLKVNDATAEHTKLPDGSVNLVTWAQSFHWIDPQLAGPETLRILAQGGSAAVIANQMDVTIPWVHRLTRIMRSGDVHRIEKPPRLPGFLTEPAQVFPWTQSLLPEEVMRLARTRSSYLRSDGEGQRRMQNNLHWYLTNHLGYGKEEVVDLPHNTLVWILHPAQGQPRSTRV